MSTRSGPQDRSGRSIGPASNRPWPAEGEELAARVGTDRRESWTEASPLVRANLLVIAALTRRDDLFQRLQEAGLGRQLVLWEEEPYAAMLRLTRHVGDRIGLVVLSLESMTSGEIDMVSTLKRMRPPVRVVIADFERHYDMAWRACRLGADAMLTGGRLFRPFGRGEAALPRPAKPDDQVAAAPPQLPAREPSGGVEPMGGSMASGSILSPEELRALLEEP